MKNIFLFVFIVSLFASPAYSSSWCYWTGTKGDPCQDDSRGYIVINGFPVKTDSVKNAKGWFKLTVNKPTPTTDQVIDPADSWSKVGNSIVQTWTVKDKTQEQKDAEEAAKISDTEYKLIKILVDKKVITSAEVPTLFSPEVGAAVAAKNKAIK